MASAKAAIDSLEVKFLAPYLSPTQISPSSQYDFDVAAYCVLAHGILEYLIEDIALTAIIAIESDWIISRRLSEPLAATLVYFSDPKKALTRLALPKDADTTVGNANDTASRPREINPLSDILQAIKEAKGEISKRINDNNGIDVDNVFALALHLGIVVKYRLPELQASESLTRFRGARAHGSPTYEPPSPNDAKTLVTIMFGLFRRIAARSAEKLSRSTDGMPL